MTLPFSTHMSGNPTHFVEKVWTGLIIETDLKLADYKKFTIKSIDQLGEPMSDYQETLITPKLHTIRTDEKDRWKEGRDIHMVINNRTPKRFQFAPVVKCLSVQKIQIKHFEASVEVEIDDEPFGLVYHHGLDEGVYEWTNTLEKLAVNDGFDSVEAFFKYFDKDFTGKIIHWTNLKY